MFLQPTSHIPTRPGLLQCSLRYKVTNFFRIMRNSVLFWAYLGTALSVPFLPFFEVIPKILRNFVIGEHSDKSNLFEFYY